MGSFNLPGFENVSTVHNSNSKLSGDLNSGKVEANSNFTLWSRKSILEVINNSNCIFNFENATANVKNCSNSRINWKNENLDVNNCSNAQIEGNVHHGTCVFSSSANLKFTAMGSLNCIFRNNSNSVVELPSGGEISAVDNTNLKISGRGVQNLSVEGSKNLVIRCMPNQTMNRFHIFDQNQAGLLYWLTGYRRSPKLQSGHNSSNLRYALEYGTTARISGSIYSSGVFNWEVINSGHEIKVESNNPEGNQLLTIDRISGNTVVISTLDGKIGASRQQLEIQGPNSLVAREDGKIIVISLARCGSPSL